MVGSCGEGSCGSGAKEEGKQSLLYYFVKISFLQVFTSSSSPPYEGEIGCALFFYLSLNPLLAKEGKEGWLTLVEAILCQG